MKLGFSSWMGMAVGAVFLGGWGSSAAMPQDARPVGPSASVTSACSSEVLRWQYDGDTHVLRLENGSVRLNCCGQRSMVVERADSVLEVTQRDEPDAGGRCAAECAYDVAINVAGVPAGETYVKLLRDVTDEGGSPALVWQGNLNLTQPSGEIVVNDCKQDRD